MVRVLLGISLALASACSIQPDYVGTEFRCADGRCPAGFECMAAICVVPEGGQPGLDAEPDPPTPRCGALDGLQDAFDGDALDARRWTPIVEGAVEGEGGEGGVAPTVSLREGAAWFTTGPGRQDATRRAGLRSVESRDPTGTLTVELGSSDADATSAVFVILRSGTHEVIVLQGEQLSIQLFRGEPIGAENRESGRLIVITADEAPGGLLRVSTPGDSGELVERASAPLPEGWGSASAVVELGMLATAEDVHDHTATITAVGLAEDGAEGCPPVGAP